MSLYNGVQMRQTWVYLGGGYTARWITKCQMVIYTHRSTK